MHIITTQYVKLKIKISNVKLQVFSIVEYMPLKLGKLNFTFFEVFLIPKSNQKKHISVPASPAE